MSALDTLRDRLGPAPFLAEADRRFFASDLFPTGTAVEPLAVLRPSNPQMVCEIAKWAAEFEIKLIARGGGVSYTGGYEPRSQRSVVLDLSDLDEIYELNTHDRYILVGAGCTWEAVVGALEGTGLRPALRGPISGSVSTVGGAASQNLPGSMDGILGLEVVLANGDRVVTGSGAVRDHTSFYRNFGPDFTGLFLGDAGIFGIKTAVCLRLEPVPKGIAYASFGFGSMAAVAEAMVQLAELNLGGRVFALDPLKNKTSTKVDMKEGLSTLKDVVKSGGLKRGLMDATKIALAGQNTYDQVAWSLHLTFEGANQALADTALQVATAICSRNGQSIEPSIPVAMNARAFSIRGFLGLKGERWVPLHGIFPLSQVTEAVAVTEAFFESHAAQLRSHQIVHSFMMSANGPYFLIEPMFYWPDQHLDLHRRHLPAHKIAKLTAYNDNAAARAIVQKLRTELRDLYFKQGAISAQIGKFYPYRDILQPGARNLFDRIKDSLDTAGCLNPGGLQTVIKGPVK